MPYRVLNIITRLEQGGAPQALLETVRRMDRSCFDISIVAGETEDQDRILDLSGTGFDLPVINVPSLRRSVHPFRDILALYHLIQIIEEGGYDLVHTHTSKAGLLGRIAASVCGVPAIVHSSHGTILQGYFSPVVTSMFALAESFASTICDRIICLTQNEIGQYVDAGIGRTEQYASIFNGIDLKAFEQRAGDRRALRAEFDFEPDDIVCVTVGRLVPVKGQSDLLRAFAEASKRNGRLRLLLLGDGELRQDLERQSEQLGILSRTTFAGWRDDVAELLDACDIFVLTSLNEGLGLVLIEAMAKQLPVVATAVGGVPDVVIDSLTGTLVRPGDYGAIAEAIAHLAMSKGLRETMGKRGYDRAHDLFSIDETVRNTEQVYRELITSR